MKIGYKILWFEDDYDLIEDYQENVESYLKSLGFAPSVVHEKNGQFLDELIQEEYDLILTDLNLGEYETGKILIDRIRGNQIYTEVLFYSGNQHEINNIMQQEKWIERVSVSVGIENLIPKVKDLINLTIRKFQDVNAMRGLLMAETSELDSLMIEVIKHLLLSFDESSSQKNIQTLITKTLENRSQKLNDLRNMEKEPITSFLEELTSYDRMCAIQRLLKQKAKDERYVGYKQTLDTYNNDIIKKRNILAHATETINEGTKIIKSELTGENIIINDEFCTTIRRDIKKHRANFEDLLQIITYEFQS
ncbi:hypothetical protein MKY59_04625 [Paenibacillus sp. FSL W8-0426]|uniref:hypothetical protein n=1 Tax=Paenibacillus sp. FSL W8-0426 TaxID=2921714 RepID=UPI0030DBF1D3